MTPMTFEDLDAWQQSRKNVQAIYNSLATDE